LNLTECLRSWGGMPKIPNNTRVAEFVNECIATFNIATPKQMKELFEAQREYYKKTFHRNTPTQDEPIETWCRMCMNLGVVHVHEIHEGHSVDMPYRCNCPAGDAFRWMPVYTTQYPVDPQFQWDGKEFYWLTYKKAVAELSRENANRKETKPTAYNETIRIQTKKRYDDLPF